MREVRKYYEETIGLWFLSCWWAKNPATWFERFLRWLAVRVRGNVIPNRDWSGPYLARFYLAPDWFPIRPYLHYIMVSDGASEPLHNHPWSRSLSLILTKGYTEERDGKPHRVRKAFSLAWVNSDTYHKVTLHNGPCWTLFFAGPRTGSWGFKLNGKHVDFKTYLNL